jgi:hypothetical protein
VADTHTEIEEQRQILRTLASYVGELKLSIDKLIKGK